MFCLFYLFSKGVSFFINLDSLFIVYELILKGYEGIYLDLLSILAIISGIFVIITKNPVISVLFLIILFLNISGYLILIGISFVGLSYILVYLGAVSILFLFTLMLINIRVSELLTGNNNSVPLGFLFGIVFYYPLNSVLPSGFGGVARSLINRLESWINCEKISLKYSIINKFEIDLSTFLKWDGHIISSSQILSIGSHLYTSYSIWLIVVSIILLLAMVGCIILVISFEEKSNRRALRLKSITFSPNGQYSYI